MTGRDLNFKTPQTNTFIGSKKQTGTRNAQTSNEYNFKAQKKIIHQQVTKPGSGGQGNQTEREEETAGVWDRLYARC